MQGPETADQKNEGNSRELNSSAVVVCDNHALWKVCIERLGKKMTERFSIVKRRTG
jgi:hypothetical protein